MTDKKTFDAQLQAFLNDLVTQIKAVNNAFQAVIDKNANAGSPLDLDAESQQLATAKGALDAMVVNLPTTPTPAASPTGVTPVGATPTTPITEDLREKGPQPVPAQPAVEAVPPPAEVTPEPPVNP